LPLEGATKAAPLFPVRALHAAISYNVFENMNRRTAEYRSEKHCLIPFKTSAVRNSLFDIRYSTTKIIFLPKSGTAGNG
jgi:hypothetical protein